MKQKFPIGISDFKEVIEKKYFYVDKSLIIKEILEESAKVLLFPRPRRFGKTLNMHMLKEFFEKREDTNPALFDNLAIHDHADCMAEQGKYPVIYLTFKDVKYSNWKDCYEALSDVIADEYIRHDDVLPHLKPLQQKEFEKIASKEASPVSFQRSLQKLSEYLHKSYDAPALILIDEHDVPIHAAFYNGYYEQTIEFMRNFLSGALKDNSHLSRAVLTGILRVARESIFSGLNNLRVFSILKDPFADKFGLTESEVIQALKQLELSSRQEEVERWYNGYGFGKYKIYNPWSIIHFLDDDELGPYWINTSDNKVISNLIEEGDAQLQKELAGLLNGETITTTLNDHIAYSDIDQDRQQIWNFLTFLGYLSIEKTHINGRKRQYDVKIPNIEVLTFFEETLIKWFNRFKVDSRLDRMLKALTTGNISEFGEELKAIVDAVMSYHDLGKKKDSPTELEKTYHMFVLGMLVRLESHYRIDSNRESGSGRYDIMLIPRDSSRQGLILEFKQVASQAKSEKALKKAMDQIKNNDYVQRLRTEGFHNNLGIALIFHGKQVWVEHCSV